MILVGNKSDLEEYRQVPTEQGKELAQRLGIPFIETSAKTNTNVSACFELLVEEWRKKCGTLLQLQWSPHWKDLTQSDNSALRKLKELIKKQNSLSMRQALLWVVVCQNFAKCVQWILKNHITPAEVQRTVKGTTFLHEAVKNRNKTIVRYLLSHGADINSYDMDNNLPIDISTSKELDNILQTHGTLLMLVLISSV